MKVPGRQSVRQRRAVGLMLCLVLAGLEPGRAAELSAPEYQVKAAFLYNFAVLTEWPTNAFASARAPLIIGVLGEDPFGPVLDQAVRDKHVGDRPLRVVRFARLEDVTDCQILFISAAEVDRLPGILSALAGRSILTVGESEDFARRGGVIRVFKRADNTLALRINVDAAAQARLKLSSKLLRLATIVHNEPSPGGG